jgi:hypothetical protein
MSTTAGPPESVLNPTTVEKQDTCSRDASNIRDSSSRTHNFNIGKSQLDNSRDNRNITDVNAEGRPAIAKMPTTYEFSHKFGKPRKNRKIYNIKVIGHFPPIVAVRLSESLTSLIVEVVKLPMFYFFLVRYW